MECKGGKCFNMYKGGKCSIIKTVLQDEKSDYFPSEVHIGRILYHYFNRILTWLWKLNQRQKENKL